MDLRPDCSRCAALCCVALAFDRSEHFAFDKPAGRACRHLAVHACAIHDELEARGFGGCARYDCAGAGQRVTMEIFGGRSWRDDPALLRPMMDAFAAVRDAHEALRAASAAKNLIRSAALATLACAPRGVPDALSSLG
jgi:hypothetical protein